jgi:hypothetical protein
MGVSNLISFLLGLRKKSWNFVYKRAPKVHFLLSLVVYISKKLRGILIDQMNLDWTNSITKKWTSE